MSGGVERRAHVAYTTDAATAEQVAREAALAAELGLPASHVTTPELPFDVAGAARFEEQAQFHPPAYCLGLAAAVTVDGDVPQDMYISVDQPTRSLRTAGDHLIVGGEGHKVGEPHDTSEDYRNPESWARQHSAVASVDHRWSAQDWAAADGAPYIGRMAGHDDGVYLATAFRKWGMTHGTVAAMLIRDLIAGRDNPCLELHDATRIAPEQSIKGLISENVSAVKHFVGDRLGADGADALPSSSPATARSCASTAMTSPRSATTMAPSTRSRRCARTWSAS